MTRLDEIRQRLGAYKHWKEKAGESLDETHAPDMGWLISRVERLEGALSAFVFDEEIPTTGKSYWLAEFDLKEAREALTEGEERG